MDLLLVSTKYGASHMVYSLMKIASERRGNEIVFDGDVTPGLFYGELGSAQPSERVNAIAQLLDGTPLHYCIIEDILTEMWYKFALNVSKNQPQTIEGKGSPAAKRARYSTLQDLDAKRHTEVDMFAGTMIRLGKEPGVPTPYNEFTYHVIKALEEKNDGLFDYEETGNK